MALRFQFAEEDRAAFGEEWYEFDQNRLLDVESAVLEDFEEQTGYTVGEFGDAIQRGSVKGLRAMMWLARRLAGHTDPWKTFSPKVLKADFADDTEPAEPGGKTEAVVPNRADRRSAAKRSES